MKATSDSAFRDIVEAAKQQGWRIEQTGKGHWKFVPPNRKVRMFFTGGTPSDNRWIKKVRSDLRRLGLQV